MAYLKFKLIIIPLLALTIACSQNNQCDIYDSFQNEMRIIKMNSNHANVLSLAQDSVLGWINLGIKDVNYLNESKWVIDSNIFFNHNYTKCLLLLVYLSNDTANIFNGAKVIAGEFQDMTWRFYYRSYPTFLTKSYANSISYSDFNLNEITKYAELQLLEDGLINVETCDLNYSYIERPEWFSEWRLKQHDAFLKNR